LEKLWMEAFGLKTPFIFSDISRIIWKWVGKSYTITILHEAYKLNPILLQIQTDITLRQNLVS
jgi:hypothetical protein